MNGDQQGADGREVIPAGTFLYPVEHLFPIARLLAERGHVLLREIPGATGRQDGVMGFIPQPDCWRCPVKGVITPQDWAAINERFALPRSITYHPGAWGGGGTITDNANYVDIIGARDPNEPGNDAELFAVIRPYDPREDAARG